MTRKTFYATVAAGWLGLAVLFTGPALGEPIISAAGSVPESGTIRFDVYRKGDRIGRHNYAFDRDGDRLVVDVDVKLKVDFLFITVFRYEHSSTEVWRDGRLTQLSTLTEQNGKSWSVDASMGNDGLVVSGANGTRVLEGPLFPTSYWNRASVEMSPWLNTQFGSPIDMTISPLGTETVTAFDRTVEAERYKVKGFIVETRKPVDIDLWYSRDGELVKLQFVAGDGSLIEYRRKA